MNFSSFNSQIIIFDLLTLLNLFIFGRCQIVVVNVYVCRPEYRSYVS